MAPSSTPPRSRLRAPSEAIQKLPTQSTSASVTVQPSMNVLPRGIVVNDPGSIVPVSKLPLMNGAASSVAREVPPAVVTVTLPVVTPDGRPTVRRCPDRNTSSAGTGAAPANSTVVALSTKPLPASVATTPGATSAPTGIEALRRSGTIWSITVEETGTPSRCRRNTVPVVAPSGMTALALVASGDTPLRAASTMAAAPSSSTAGRTSSRSSESAVPVTATV